MYKMHKYFLDFLCNILPKYTICDIVDRDFL